MKQLQDYKTIILASQSPRRLEILRAHGVEPVVMPTDADETLPDGIGMEEAVRRISRVKAEACYNELMRRLSAGEPDLVELTADALIIAADTVVYTDALGIMGKPADYDEAFLMLATIRNTYHYVATGVTLIELCGGRTEDLNFADVTEVWCKNYTDQEIDEYIAIDAPYDKAGSYAIQSAFGKHIDHIEGDYENVVGLPFNRIVRELKIHSQPNL